MATEQMVLDYAGGWTDERLTKMFHALTWGGRVKAITFHDFTWNPPNLADGAGDMEAQTIKGAQVGDFVLIAPGADVLDCIFSGAIVSVQRLEVRVQNESLSARNIATSTWTAIVFNFQ